MPCALLSRKLETVVVGNAAIFPGLNGGVCGVRRVRLRASRTGDWNVLIKSYSEVCALRSNVRTTQNERVRKLMLKGEVPLADVRSRVSQWKVDDDRNVTR